MRKALRALAERQFLIPFLAIVATSAVLVTLLNVLVQSPLFRPNYVHMWATVVLLTYFWGIFVLPNQKLHMRFAFVGIALDVTLTLWHEVGLKALSFAMGIKKVPFQGDEGLLWGFHIPVSVALLVFYVLVWLTGRQLVPGEQLIWKWLPQPAYNKRRVWKQVHRVVGVTTLLLNAMSYVSSPFWILEYAIASR